MIRIAHVITSLEVGGAQRMLEKLVSRADPARLRPRVFTLIEGGRLRRRLEAAGVEVEALGMRPGVPDPRAVVRLRRRLREFRPDVVQTWLYHADLVGTLAARWAGVPKVAWNVRCTYQPVDASSWSARTAPKLCARLSPRADLVLHNSTLGRTSHAAIGYSPPRWLYLPNGFDLERFRPVPGAREALRRQLELPPTARIVGMVARFDPLKDHGLALAAARRLESSGIEVVLVGVDAEQLAGLGDGLPGNVHALGERDDVRALVPGFDVLLSTSRAEGFPNVIGEAMACGVPCVATDVGDCALVIGDTGRVVATATPEAVAAALAALALEATAPEREERARAARARVAEHFELGEVAERYATTWEELVEARPCAV